MADNLFQLIKSLSPGEKRYFKLYAARQSESKKTNYEKLFDEFNELEDNKPYDEDAFIKKLQKKSLGKYFSDDKNYLTQLVLKAMRSYASEKKADAQLADMIQEINFLMLKGLADHCTKICDKAWEIAEEREMTEQKVRLIAIRRMIDRSEYKATRLDYQNDLHEQEDKALAQLEDEREAAYLYEKVYCIYVMHDMSGRAEDVDFIYDRLDTLHQKEHLTFDCINTIIRAKCVVLDHRLKFKEALELIKQLVEQWEKNPWRIKEQTERYVKLLGNLLIFISRTATYEELLPLIQKLESIEASEREVLKDLFYLISFCRVVHYFISKTYRESLSEIPSIRKGLKEYDALLTFIQKRAMLTNICMIYLKNKMFSEVLDAVQEVYMLSGRDKEKQHRIEDMRVYEFIAHYELGNIDLLHYTIRNNQRFFKEREPDNEFIDNIWKLLRQLVQDTDKPKTAKQKLKSALEPLSCPDTNAALKRELIEWLDRTI